MSGGKVYELKGAQREAADPGGSVWLSASAGTGKTQVLSARVLRLLLEPGVHPSQILCLTFTKAGAAEMAVRVNEVLARWVRLKGPVLAKELLDIGASNSPETQGRARTLFASVLDCPGGGLRIDTIHAFATWLLGAFPEEAGLVPGTRPMEDRDRELLERKVLTDLLLEIDQRGEQDLLEALATLSKRMGPDGVQAWLKRCAEAMDAWREPGGWKPPMDARVRRLLGLAADADEASLAELTTDAAFDLAALRACAETQAAWGSATGLDCAALLESWLGLPPDLRADRLGELEAALFTQKGEVKNLARVEKLLPDYADYAARVRESLDAVLERKRLLEVAKLLTPALTIGRRFALAWDEAKAREGLIDFDDQIRRAAALLATKGLGEWIRYKLDRRFDHILIDEAQDTNEVQWEIVDALAGDFFTGEGQRDGKLRTIFVVGDYKQAIFRFQGTSPKNFESAKRRFAGTIAAWARNAKQMALELREEEPNVRDLADLSLDQSYRSAKPLLQFVDAAIDAIGIGSFGLDRHPGEHVGEDRPGLVALWKVIGGEDDDDAPADDEDTWFARSDRRLAETIAQQVASWMRDGFPLVKDRDNPRLAGPGDVMVLVRKRKDLAGLIVARLHAAGVPVAGVDRLRLGAPLSVKDLMAALRFAAQPLDDLNLANLLSSPLIGWSQEQLLEHVWRPRGVGLWDHLRRSRHADLAQARALLDPLLALADYEPPQALLHWILVGPWRGRAKLVARLGREAEDPIDELVNAALAFAATQTPSLHGFIQWFDAGEGELKREAEGAGGQVRVLTVHGAKGLQSPIVILADAAGNPDRSPARGLTLTEELPGGGRTIPLPSLRKEEKAARILAVEEEAKARDKEEHWRLLYVAMTRAEEALFVAGALGPKEKEPAPDSWYARLLPLFEGEPIADDLWGERREWGALAPVRPAKQSKTTDVRLELPPWAQQPIGPEPRPPRPLAPSSAGEDASPDPPLPSDALREAARRGVLMHKLLERLPEVAVEDRAEAAGRWLDRHAADLAPEVRSEIARSALAVLGEPKWAAIFGPNALAEAPLAATVEGQVIAGTADRLLVEQDRVLVVDFKTARRPPESLDQVPLSTMRQMGAYAAALGVIYPGRRIEAALLYTHAPRLIALSSDVLAAHKPALSTAQESFPG
jgi:ATP-dependent helicase/nuclease subunit A